MDLRCDWASSLQVGGNGAMAGDWAGFPGTNILVYLIFAGQGRNFCRTRPERLKESPAWMYGPMSSRRKALHRRS